MYSLRQDSLDHAFSRAFCLVAGRQRKRAETSDKFHRFFDRSPVSLRFLPVRLALSRINPSFRLGRWFFPVYPEVFYSARDAQSCTQLIKIVVANRSVIKIAASSGLARGLEKRNDPERTDIEQLCPFTEFSPTSFPRSLS